MAKMKQKLPYLRRKKLILEEKYKLIFENIKFSIQLIKQKEDEI